MLCRTADHLFWAARYMERAENTARMLNVAYETSLLPHSAQVAQVNLLGLLSISQLMPDYHAKYGEDVTLQGVLDFMVRDESNPASIIACIRSARENARAVRGSLTTEAWEMQNQTWLEVRRLLSSSRFGVDPGEFFEWVRFRSHMSRGVIMGSMLQDESLHFLRLGTFLERADNTARLLDVKFHALDKEFHGSLSERDQDFDFYHWNAVLGSFSAFEVYRKVYRDVITPERVAALLILHPGMPRSLLYSMLEVVHNLERVGNGQSQETERQAGRLLAELQYGRIDEILATGLHAFLTQFLSRVNDLGVGIGRDFLAAY